MKSLQLLKLPKPAYAIPTITAQFAWNPLHSFFSNIHGLRVYSALQCLRNAKLTPLPCEQNQLPCSCSHYNQLLIPPCTGEYFNSSSSMKKTSIQVHTNDQSSSKPVICHLYEPELTLFSWMNLNRGIPLYMVHPSKSLEQQETQGLFLFSQLCISQRLCFGRGWSQLVMHNDIMRY